MAFAQVYGYPVEVLRRPYQRNIGVSVRPNGLIRVTASRSASERAIRRFLCDCEPWLKKVLSEYEILRKQYPQKRFLQGEGFLFLGQMRFLNYIPTTLKRWQFKIDEQHLHCFVPKESWRDSYHMLPQPHVKDHLLKFYELQGRELLGSRLQVFAERMGLHPTGVTFRSQKTRWGSCSSQGKISLNWRLVAAPIEALDYVVIHELSHLRYQNHSSRFWQLVSLYSPCYQQHRQWLRDHQYEFDFLARESELHPLGPEIANSSAI